MALSLLLKVKLNYKVVCSVICTCLSLSCRQPYYTHYKGSQQYSVGQQYADTLILQFVQKYKAGIDSHMQALVATTDMPFTKAQPECTMGNLVADAVWKAARHVDSKVVAAIINYGSIQLPYINPGNINKRILYEMIPFDNVITIIEMTGSSIKQLCDTAAAAKGWPVSHLQFIIDHNKATGIKVNGDILNDNIVYRIATNDYIARGGDRCSFLSGLKRHYTKILVRDAVIDYVSSFHKENKILHVDIENRIRYAE